MNSFCQTKRMQPQRGVVLIVALIILVVISMLATFSVRNSTSTETASGAVRTANLAAQAAEIALRYCEDAVLSGYSSSPTFVTTFDIATNVLSYSSTPTWKIMSNWDNASTTATYVLPGTAVNQTGLSGTFSRPPECMVEALPMQMPAGGAASNTVSFVITVRGFGPEVQAVASGASRRPSGTEVWLQSTIELMTPAGAGGGGGGAGGGSGDDGGDYGGTSP